MREIKFRQYIPQLKRFHYWGLLDRKSIGPIHDTNLPGYYDSQQFTGMFDAKNVPIYEGDIIDAWSEDGGAYKFLGTFPVEYDNNWAGFTAKGIYMLETCDRTIVKGNIHENPDLLK